MEQEPKVNKRLLTTNCSRYSQENNSYGGDALRKKSKASGNRIKSPRMMLENPKRTSMLFWQTFRRRLETPLSRISTTSLPTVANSKKLYIQSQRNPMPHHLPDDRMLPWCPIH